MIANRHLDELHDHIRRFTKAYSPARVRGTFTSAGSTVVAGEIVFRRYQTGAVS